MGCKNRFAQGPKKNKKKRKERKGIMNSIIKSLYYPVSYSGFYPYPTYYLLLHMGHASRRGLSVVSRKRASHELIFFYWLCVLYLSDGVPAFFFTLLFSFLFINLKNF